MQPIKRLSLEDTFLILKVWRKLHKVNSVSKENWIYLEFPQEIGHGGNVTFWTISPI
jgi:hypothetical protein